MAHTLLLQSRCHAQLGPCSGKISDFETMREMSKVRFDAFASYARTPMSLVAAEELAWFEQANERVLGVLFRDRTDGDYAGIILARDRRGRFRCVEVSAFDKSRRRAKAEMRRRMEAVAQQDDSDYIQGDERGKPLDLFMHVLPRERLHPDFLTVSEREGYSSARGIIEQMMHWYEDPDGNFVEQFQSTGFDARIWELYLFATFSELGYEIDRTQAVPDFTCKKPGLEICVEATTVARSLSGPLATLPELETEKGRSAFLKEFLPLKYGSALYSKLQKKYWEKNGVNGKPLVFAIADFQGGLSMLMSRSALPIYLYGCDWDWHRDDSGRLHITPRKVEMHRWGTKESPSGFFALKGAENISAVFFNNSGTISKFLRIGKLARFGSDRVTITRVGTVVDHDPNASEPMKFRHIVNDPSYSENWVEGFDVFHNPNALYPLENWMLPGASHHRILPSGQMDTVLPDWQPLASTTQVIILTEEKNPTSA